MRSAKFVKVQEKYYQLAFFTPGKLPASALRRNWYCAYVRTE
jgi:hypothetical protein